MDMNPLLKDALVNVDFLKRFARLSEKYSDMESSLEDADLEQIQRLIECRGYSCIYNKKYRFFKIAKDSDKKSSIHLDVKYGIAEFILNISINGEGSGGPYSYLTAFLGKPERVKDPFFSNYEELDEILKEGFSIYEDIKSELKQVMA